MKRSIEEDWRSQLADAALKCVTAKGVVVADAGMLSAANLNAIEDAGFDFIVGSRTDSAPKDLVEHDEKVGSFFPDGQCVETVRGMGDGRQYRERRVVWQHSRKREKRDNITLNKQIDRAEQIANGQRHAKKDRSVTLVERGARPGVNWSAAEKVGPYLGLKGYVTSISASVLTGVEVVAAYHDVFRVDASFGWRRTI